MAYELTAKAELRIRNHNIPYTGLELSHVDDTNPMAPRIYYNVTGTLDEVAFEFDGATTSLGPQADGTHYFDLDLRPSVRKLGLHSLVIKARQNTNTLTSTTTFNNSRMEPPQSYVANWPVFTEISLPKNLKAFWQLNVYKWEWALPGSKWDRLIDGVRLGTGRVGPTSMLTLASSIPEDLSSRNSAQASLTIAHGRSDGEVKYKKVSSLGNNATFGGVFEVRGSNFGKAGVTSLTLKVSGQTRTAEGLFPWVFFPDGTEGMHIHILK